MNLKNTTVIINDAEKFLNWDMRVWISSDGQFFVGTRANAIRVARHLLKTGKAGPCRVFVATDYGYVSECREEVLVDGQLGPPTYPNNETKGGTS